MTERDTHSIAALLAAARARFPEPAEAEILLAHCLGVPRSHLHAHGERTVPEATRERFRSAVERRERGEPVAYILGRRGFWTEDLAVDPRVLIPRPETETLVEAALARLPKDAVGPVADLGTGSGAIAVALLQERPGLSVVATDLDPDALAVAADNARDLGLAGRLELLRGVWFEPLEGRRFPLILSNPPYVAEYDPHLDRGDLRFEPRHALAAGADGLADLRRIAAEAPDHLEAGGWLLLEHGFEQAEAVRGLLAAAGFEAIATHRDLAGHERVTEALWNDHKGHEGKKREESSHGDHGGHGGKRERWVGRLRGRARRAGEAVPSPRAACAAAERGVERGITYAMSVSEPAECDTLIGVRGKIW